MYETFELLKTLLKNIITINKKKSCMKNFIQLFFCGIQSTEFRIQNYRIAWRMRTSFDSNESKWSK